MEHCTATTPTLAPGATDPAITMPRLALSHGLLRYRRDRFGLLLDLGRDQQDLVETSIGGLRLVIATGADPVRAVLKEHAARFGKGPGIDRHARPLLGNGMISSTGAAHRAQRKMLAPKFQPRHIAGYASTITALADEMIARWRRDEPTDLAHEMMALALHIATRTMFGADVRASEIATIGRSLDLIIRYVTEEQSSLLHVPLGWPTPRNQRVRAALCELDAVVYRLIAERRAGQSAGQNPGQHNDQTDVLSVLLDARDEDGQPLSDEHIRDQVMTFFVAGHETTATTLIWAFELLTRHPHVARTLATEVEAACGTRTPEHADLARLGYVQQVVQEVLRLRPPLYMIGRQAHEDVTLGQHVIRKGAYVIINALGMHRRADYFAQPEDMVPERFAHKPPWPRDAYVPFGAGPRVCIGNHFAMMTSTLVLARLAQVVELRTGEPAWDHDMLLLRPRGQMPFQLAWRSA